MLNAGGALVSSSVNDSASHNDSSRGLTINVKIRGSGRFGAFSSRVPSTVKVNGALTDFYYASADQLCTLDIRCPEEGDVTLLVFAFIQQ